MDGIINVYKEKGYTSHDVVAKLRGILHQKKIGHTGTLDPDAEGVLPVCIGSATKVCDMLTDRNKTYRAVLLLGRTTDTQDVTGTVLRERPVFCGPEDVRSCIKDFIGEQQQIPPMYSALKVGGRKLYELARQGIEVERSPRTIIIEDIQIIRLQLPEIEMIVRCSKGTYIRTLCHDIGERLGCGGCMESLLRTQVGPFTLEESVRLDEIEILRDAGRLNEIILAPDTVFSHLDAVLLTSEAERLVRNGNPLSPRMLQDCRKIVGARHYVQTELPADECRKKTNFDTEAITDGEQLRLYGQKGEFLAVYSYHESRHSWRVVKMFLSA